MQTFLLIHAWRLPHREQAHQLRSMQITYSPQRREFRSREIILWLCAADL